jgi:hypothetical protein
MEALQVSACWWLCGADEEDVMEIDPKLVVGYVIAWCVVKARRVAGRLDSELDATIDATMDAGLARLHHAVAAKLDGDPALEELEAQVEEDAVTALTQHRVELAVQAAAGKDQAFAADLAEALGHLQMLDPEGAAAATYRIELPRARGVQIGQRNQQTNVFGFPGGES